MPVTIKDIASYAGVSPATVSLALQGKACVAEATGIRIRDLAKRLGYTPSAIGRALQSGRSGLIGYLLNSVASSYFNEVMQGVGCEAAKEGYGLLTALTGGSRENVATQLAIFKEKRVDGLLVSSDESVDPGALLEFEKDGRPLVFCSAESQLPGVPASVADDFLGGELAARHFIERGARRLVYFNDTGCANRRFEGFAAATASAGLGGVGSFASLEALRFALSAPAGERPDAVFCYSDAVAVKAHDLILGLGLSMPRDVMLVGYDDSNVAALPCYNLSSLAPQKQETGACAVRLLFERIAGKSPASVRLAPSLIERGSSAR